MFLTCVVLPVRTCGVAEWGTIAASCGREPISGSGVLLGGELANGDITILGFSCTYSKAHTHIHTHKSINQEKHKDAGGPM